MNKKYLSISLVLSLTVIIGLIILYQTSSQQNLDHLRRQRSQVPPSVEISQSKDCNTTSNEIAVSIDKGVQTTANLINGQFSLTDHNGKQRTQRDFLGRLTVVYFGYTFCPDICPQALSNISQALYVLKSKTNDLNVLFITVDPERDTVPELARYLENFHPRITALTGTLPQVEQAAQGYRVYYAKTHSNNNSDYLLDHTSIVYVMDKRGRYVTSFNHETTPKEILAILRPLLP